MSRAPPAAEPDEEDADEVPTPAGRPKARSEPVARPSRSHRRASGLKAWDDPADSTPAKRGGDDEDVPSEDDGEEERRPIYLRARDAWWFEPLVALAIIVVLLASLYAYTSNWPPVYVVESESMQHGYNDQVGLINTGDLVLAQHVDPSMIVPYMVGMQTGYSTYGEYGDVILYHPNGDYSGAPIIHRSIVYVDYNPNGSYSIPQLEGLPCGNASNAVYYVSDHASGCGPLGLRGELSLFGIGWQSTEVDVALDPTNLGRHSGFLTMGDNNFDGSNDSSGITDQDGGLSQLVETGWIIGVARGMIPWFGSLKLALDDQSGEVPPQSWQYMGLTIVVLFVIALSIHLFLRREGIEDDRRRLREDEEAKAAQEEHDDGPPKPKAPRRGLRLWAADDDDIEDPADTPPKGARKGRASRSTSKAPTPAADSDDEAASSRGRPKPRIGRHPPKPAPDDEDDAEL